jgi:hypothetical protein
LDAIREFQRELVRYQEAVREVVESLGAEARRAGEWIEQDRVRYWPREVRKAEERVVTARAELERSKMAAMSHEHKSCLDEKKLVEAAIAQLRRCEQKVREAREWNHKVRHATQVFSGKIARLVHYLDVDLPQALAALDRILRALEQYSETAHHHTPTLPAGGQQAFSP